ncbi:MAG TPA: hypothetical protein VNQ76_19680 [Planctomicrobium sp.]|nr:hypothetical protein [Planctomicrobium sp.]
MKQTLTILFGLSLLAGSGCTRVGDFPEIAKTHGTVTYQGKPLASANVIFTPEAGPIAVGTTDEQGYFELLTQGKNGAKIGKHCVMIQAVAPKGGSDVVSIDPTTGSDVSVEIVSRIPERYGKSHQSGLTADVSPKGENSFSFDLQ